MDGRVLDLYAAFGRGTVVVSEVDPGRWLLTWLPHSESDPNHPGFTLDSNRNELPIVEESAEELLAWVLGQEWVKDEEGEVA